MNTCVFTCLFAVFSVLSAADFVVGTTSGYAPFVSLDEKGDYVGFDIDIAKQLSKKLNRTLVIKDLGSMPALFLALKQEKVDALIWAISITRERQDKVAMIYYQGEKVTTLPLVFCNDKVASLQELAQDPTATVCVEAGSFQESFLQTVEGLRITYVDKVTDALLQLKYGKAQATMMDSSLVPKYKKQFPELTVLDVALPDALQSCGNGICINKSRVELIQEVENAIQQMQQEGEIRKLEEKWGLVSK